MIIKNLNRDMVNLKGIVKCDLLSFKIMNLSYTFSLNVLHDLVIDLCNRQYKVIDFFTIKSMAKCSYDRAFVPIDRISKSRHSNSNHNSYVIINAL